MRALGLFLLATTIGCDSVETCGDPVDGQSVFDVGPEDLAAEGAVSTDVSQTVCIALCEDLGGLEDITSCTAEDIGDGWATISCEGVYACG